MTDPGWQTDTQWARAVGAALVGFLLLYGVMSAGGPAALAHEARPVARLVAALYCMTMSGSVREAPSRASCPAPGC